jgi:hypothetical protein
MKYYETSALSGNNVENMFFAVIDDITVMQQARRKKLSEQDELDLNPPLTTDNLKSERHTTHANDTQSEREEAGMKIKAAGSGWRGYCCKG